MARKHAARSSAHDTGDDSTPSARWRTERLSNRTESPLSCSRSPSTVILFCVGDCSISSFVFGGGARCDSSENMLSSWYEKTRIGQGAGISLVAHASANTVSAWGSCRRNGVVSDRTILHRYDVCDSSVTGAGAEETNSALCMLYQPYQSVRLCRSNPPLDSTRPFWRTTEYDLGHSLIPRWHPSMRAARRQGVLEVVRCGTRPPSRVRARGPPA